MYLSLHLLYTNYVSRSKNSSPKKFMLYVMLFIASLHLKSTLNVPFVVLI